MDNAIKRRILFLLGCIPTRFFLAYTLRYSVSKNTNPIIHKILILLLTCISIGFAVIYIFNLRDTGAEVFGDKIWWNHLRPVHSLMYGLAGFLLYFNNIEMSSLVIFIDTLIGLTAHLTK